MANNYVKFLKGSPDAYANCVKASDTLYFIYTEGSKTGKLYLGDILISNGATENGQIPENIIDTLAELLDVDVSLKQQGQVLGYDGEKWVPMDLSTACACSVMTGATADKAGTAGYVPAPQAGDENKFLRGDGKWIETVSAEDFSLVEGRVDVLEETQENISSSMTWGELY